MRIKSVDLTRARAAEGVLAAVSGDDFPCGAGAGDLTCPYSGASVSRPEDCPEFSGGGGGGGGGGGCANSHTSNCGEDDDDAPANDPDAADEATTGVVDNCVRGAVSGFGAITPHTIIFDDNLTGTGDMDGDGNIDTDENGVAIAYPAEAQARRVRNANGETIRYETVVNIPVIRSVAGETGQTMRERLTDTMTHEYVHHVHPTWSEAQVEAEGQQIYDDTTKTACGTE